MGSYITLGVENLELDWGKNHLFRDYSKLFLPTDKKDIAYYYADNEIIYKPGYSRSLSKVKGRLELLGYSLAKLKDIYQAHQDDMPDHLSKPKISFEELLYIFSNISIKNYKREEENIDSWDYNLGEYFIENILNNELFVSLRKYIDKNDEEIGAFFENIDPHFILRLLIENPANLDMNLEWRIDDIIEGGWITEEELYVGLEENDKFLIVTEGSSDSLIIKKSLELLKPDILDFFTFIDMEENYPFTGTGNLYRFICDL